MTVADPHRAIESDELVRALVATAPGGIVRIGHDGQVLDANAEATRLLGLRKDEFTGMYVADFENRVVDERGHEVKVEDFPVSRTLATGAPAGPSTLGVMRPDGAVAWAIYHAVPLRNADGACAGALVTLLDVTDRVRAEEELRRSEERWRSLFENIPEFVILTDREGFIRAINRTVPDLRPADVVGMPLAAFLPPESAVVMAERLAHVIDTGETVVCELEGRGEGTAIEWYEDVIAPMRQNDEIVGSIVIARMVTARKRIERELAENRRLAAIGMLSAGIAHEINNPLTYILGNVAHAQARVQDPVLVEVLEDARRGAERVRTIVRDLKLLAREPDQATGPVELARVIDAALGIVDSEVRHRATVVRAYAEMPPVRGNEVRLMQVALNLVINAIQAIPDDDHRRHEVRVSTRADGRWGEMVIEDDGGGIAPEHLPRVFEPFFTTKPTGVGTGLGLAICQGIVAAAGGSIAIDSELGRGTRVVVRLPLSVALDTCVAENAADATCVRQRVLVIDDDAAVARTLKRMLAAEHEVECVHDGEQALALLEHQRFDVVLCDVMMPQRSGVEIYELVRDRDAAQASRFVMLSGGVFSPTLRERLDGYRVPCLTKPIDRTGLLQAIARHGAAR